MREYSSLLSIQVLDKLDTLGNQRNIEFGKLIRDHPQGSKIKKVLAQGIIESKRRLFMENHIQDADVLSIKNDAVFIIGRKLQRTKFGHVEFAEKNVYTSYIHIGTLEFYYNTKLDVLSVKGLSDDIINTPDHQSGMILFVKTVLKHLRTGNKQALRKYLKQFSSDYKALKLPYQYYRELNTDNCYRSKYDIEGFTFNYTQINNDLLNELVITYNYKYFILPLIQQLYW